MRAKRRKPAGAKRVARRPTNVTVRADLVERAKALRLNLSNVLETALITAIREREQQAWLAENEEAIDGANEHMREHGLFGDDWRPF